ncbi:MAG: hypothetical protein LUE16_06480 [Lachnospiraceae bacterium]|nr:hypothetical protein [Lachnospiraceae bacterium]
MVRNNSMGLFKFVILHIFWGLACLAGYRRILFNCFGSLPSGKSMLMLCGIVAATGFAGIYLEKRNARNWVSIFLNLSIGYGIYTVLACYGMKKIFITVCLALAIYVTFQYACCVLEMDSWVVEGEYRIPQMRVAQIACVAQISAGLGMALVMAVLSINVLTGAIVMEDGTVEAFQESAAGWTIDNHMETILKLQPDIWDSLEDEEKLEVLQTAAYIEQYSLGIPDHITVVVTDLEGCTLGSCTMEENVIYIDTDHFNDGWSWDVLNSVCHEAYHCYQYCLVDVLGQVDTDSKNLQMFSRVTAYAYEFNHYISGSEDYESYYSQKCEIDAREYAEEAAYKYYEMVYDYLYETEG